MYLSKASLGFQLLFLLLNVLFSLFQTNTIVHTKSVFGYLKVLWLGRWDSQSWDLVPFLESTFGKSAYSKSVILCKNVLIRGFSRFSSALLIAKCDFLSVSNKHYNTDTKCFWMVQKQSLIHLRSIRFHYRDDFKVLWNWVKWTKFYSLGLWNE